MADVKIEFGPGDAYYSSSAFPQFKKIIGTNFPVPGLYFDAGTDEAAFFHFIALNYASSPVLRFYWYADTASSGDVVWGCQIGAITANTDSQDIETKSLATAQTVTDSHIGTTGQRLHSCDLTISNVDSLAADDYVAMRVYRDADAGGDTLTGDAIIVKLVLIYTST